MKIRYTKKEMNEKILTFLEELIDIKIEKKLEINGEIFQIRNQIIDRLERQARRNK